MILLGALVGAALAATWAKGWVADATTPGGVGGPLPKLALPWALFTSACAAVALYAADLYDLRKASADRSRGGRRTMIALAAVCALVALRAAFGGSEERSLAVGALLAAALVVLLLRAALPWLIGKPLCLLLVSGETGEARRIGDELTKGSELAVEVRTESPGAGRPRDERGGLLERARRSGAEWIVVCGVEDEALHRELVAARSEGLLCLRAPMAYERLLRRIPVDALRPEDLAFAEGFQSAEAPGWWKRALDVSVAAAGLLLALPLLATAAIAIRLGSKGPVFYRQERVGWRGRRFHLYKLRTMRVDAEAEGAPRWASENDPRITPVGRLLRKSRIDEIPQLWSVLRGDMSLVGPRPERPYFVERLEAEIPWYALRHALPPGVTGWAQIRFPYGASIEDAKRKLEYDLYYVKNASFFLDVAILFHTVRHVLMARGAR